MEPFASTEEKTAYQDRRTRRRLATGFATVVAIWLGAFVGAAAMNRAHDDAPLHETFNQDISGWNTSSVVCKADTESESEHPIRHDFARLFTPLFAPTAAARCTAR